VYARLAIVLVVLGGQLGCPEKAPVDTLAAPAPVSITAQAGAVQAGAVEPASGNTLPTVAIGPKVPNADNIVRCAVRRARRAEGARLKMGTDATLWVDVSISHQKPGGPVGVYVDSWWRRSPSSVSKVAARGWEPMASEADAQHALDRILARIWGGDAVKETCAP
jgi:hypothetical protein